MIDDVYWEKSPSLRLIEERCTHALWFHYCRLDSFDFGQPGSSMKLSLLSLLHFLYRTKLKCKLIHFIDRYENVIVYPKNKILESFIKTFKEKIHNFIFNSIIAANKWLQRGMHTFRIRTTSVNTLAFVLLGWASTCHGSLNPYFFHI